VAAVIIITVGVVVSGSVLNDDVVVDVAIVAMAIVEVNSKSRATSRSWNKLRLVVG
jgi:hypothetical protein